MTTSRLDAGRGEIGMLAGAGRSASEQPASVRATNIERPVLTNA